MMSTERFERDLPALLENLAEPQTPDYFDDLFWQTAHTSQRSAWTIPERWLPMLQIARQPVVAAQPPWRPAASSSSSSSRSWRAWSSPAPTRRLPPPYGPAANGMIATLRDGDIQTFDPRTGVSRAIVTGPRDDVDPVWSPDGTRLVFKRMTVNGSGLIRERPGPMASINTLINGTIGRLRRRSVHRNRRSKTRNGRATRSTDLFSPGWKKKSFLRRRKPIASR